MILSKWSTWQRTWITQYFVNLLFVFPFFFRGNRAGADCVRTGTSRLTSLLECQAHFFRKLKDDHLRYRLGITECERSDLIAFQATLWKAAEQRHALHPVLVILQMEYWVQFWKPEFCMVLGSVRWGWGCWTQSAKAEDKGDLTIDHHNFTEKNNTAPNTSQQWQNRVQQLQIKRKTLDCVVLLQQNRVPRGSV